MPSRDICPLTHLLFYSLAYANIYLTTATLVRSIDLELCGTDESDVEIARDIMAAGTRSDSRGLRVVIKGKSK